MDVFPFETKLPPDTDTQRRHWHSLTRRARLATKWLSLWGHRYLNPLARGRSCMNGSKRSDTGLSNQVGSCIGSRILLIKWRKAACGGLGYSSPTMNVVLFQRTKCG